MNASGTQKNGTLGRTAAVLLVWALGFACASGTGPAYAAQIENTASVTYRHGNAVASKHSNTVITQILPSPTQASLGFLRFDPDPSGTQPRLPIDGGQCRIEGGSFAPMPALVGSDGQPLDPGEVGTTPAPGYYTGEPIVITVSDVNRNADPAAREYVDVDITTSTGDAETLRLQETGADTGVFAGAIQSVPMPPAAAQWNCALSLAAFAEITARYTDTDFPLDALAVAAIGYAPLEDDTVIRLEQTVSRDIVEIGEFLQYTLVVRNIHDVPATNVRIRDELPPGLRFQAGSLRIGAPTVPDSPDVTPAPPAGGNGATTAAARVPARPAVEAGATVSSDGRTLQFPAGNLAPGSSITATFIAEVGAGAAGQHLLNYAIATANGSLSSNETDTVVRMRESLNTTRFTLVGRVFAVDSCEVPPAGAAGVPHVQLLLQDGTFVASDENGAYHFEGLRPGTHVVQLDPASIPADMEPVACQQNTRFAGRADSQFVEAQGGTLWRADFYLRRKTGAVGAQLAIARAADGKLSYSAELDGGKVPVAKLRAMIMLPAGSTYLPGSARVDGELVADPALSDGLAIFSLGDPGTHWRRRLTFEAARPAACEPGKSQSKLVGLFDAGGKSGQRTPAIELDVACDREPGTTSSQRNETRVDAAAEGPAASPFEALAQLRAAIADDATAAGSLDPGQWFVGQEPGRDFLFPAADYNPRSPTSAVVIKHLPGEKPRLRVNGEQVDPHYYDGSTTSADRRLTVTRWRALPLLEGDNKIEVEIVDATGATVATLDRAVHFANTPARIELVSDRSALFADGIHRPVIAVRVLDRTGRPVRKGMTGPFSISAPYQAAVSAGKLQQQQIAGIAGDRPVWLTEGDDGIAYIELQPTGNAGSASLSFEFSDDKQTQAQELQVWLKAAPRDWVVVGFAKGGVGYETLQDNMQALQPGEDGKGVRGESQVALYAKGRVLGKWLLTLAYDSDKPTDRLRDQSLLSTIDPGQYYTLYGDAAQQGYDAASARKVYLKLERDQFYALFGDFQTGLDRNQLSRYQRTLTGVKVEYRGPMLEFNGFAAETAQNYVRDELQGDGTSGLYRLRSGPVVLNSERIRIETRDRYHSEQILESRELSRHIDYDIDYDNGTLFFREPIASRDFDFNPIWIVAEYETVGTGEEFLNGGGRVGIRAMEGRLEAGATYIRDQDALADSQLAGLDAKFRLTPNAELRAEYASSRSEGSTGESSGSAWLLEWEHRGEQLNFLAYARRQGLGFGLGQQGGYQSGMFKTGVKGQFRIGQRFSLQGELYREENLQADAVRDAAKLELEYRQDQWSARAGLQWAHDEGADGEVAESQQVMLGVSRRLMDGRLELGAQADFSLGGKNESVDFPTRLQVNGAYRINDAFRLLAAQEYTDGKDRDTSTTRLGFEAKPWKDATLTSTLNQSQVSEYGPRTFALMGLNQRFVVDEHWSFDVAVDSSHAFNESGDAPLVVDPSQPIQAGGIRDGGALTEDFVALSAGTTYRSELWTWNLRSEARQSDTNDRYGFTTGFMRQVRDGVAMSASAQAFSQRNADGSTGILANAQLSWAWRPLGSEWSMLDKLEFRLDELRSGTGESIIGQGTLAATGDARSARFINNFVLNYASGAWDGEDAAGNPLDLYQRSQLSLYYGSKYVIDSYGSDDYAGYTDILGAEYRFDLTRRIDIGVRASVLHSWSQDTVAWAFGPSVGFTPFANTWVSVGYNIRGFNDRDFEASHYTAEGAYLVFRMKFDQRSLGLDRGAPASVH
ncbi:MAG: hypothetical protein M3Y70_01240 [Pseudomonadota bacterium]|nr:hypothetical protein [Pseudomonadota bacterium]